ncbi:hypothetical protein PR048_033787 [Dryococelus australis]|uniref:DDE-1 domain-containing protein n=1 Tax=Dryococelus australis TaxID=614101 RepID=A0ABQ9G393_9NEOP|nr:hypothetical protein PR048_033787 [Dryococelus australis]
MEDVKLELVVQQGVFAYRIDYRSTLPGFFHYLVCARHVIGLRKQYSYLLGQIGNADQTPVNVDIPTNTTVADKSAKSVEVKTTGNYKNRITVMLQCWQMEENSPRICQEKGWMTNELVMNWVKVVWNHKPGALSRQRGMLVLYTFRGHLTPQVKKVQTLSSYLEE